LPRSLWRSAALIVIIPVVTLADPLQVARQLQAAHRLPEAEAAYRQLLAVDPENVDALHGLGWLANQVGKPQIAIQYLDQALARRPNDYLLHWHIAIVSERLGQNDRADASFARACELKPRERDLLNRWGVFLATNGKGERALETFNRVVRVDPTFAQGFRNIGLISDQLDKFPEAEAAFRRSVELEPGSAEAWQALGRTIGRSGRVEDSLEYFEKAIAITPYHFDANFNLAFALRKLKRYEDAAAPLERAMIARPGSDVVLRQMARNYSDLGKDAQALPLLNNALAVAPNDADLHGERAFALLAMGDLLEGFREYEWRWKTSTFPQNRRYSYVPQWTGFDIAGKTILLHPEQGIGDAIQFVRYTPMVAQRGARVLLQAPEEMLPLFAGVGGIAELIPADRLPPKFDLQCPLMSLPLAFGTTLQTIPDNCPYLHAYHADVKRWKPRLDVDAGQKKIGLVWAGRRAHARDAERSIPIEMFAPLSAVQHATFFSLQKGSAEKDRVPGLEMIHLGADLKSFMDTAAVIAHLDLVITSDTAVAHLAGALGKPVWNLLDSVGDFRWMRNRDDSPWYPTMRLFRQSTRGDWAGCIARVVEALRESSRAIEQ
jgi:Tfp pilus assembly protein PilF